MSDSITSKQPIAGANATGSEKSDTEILDLGELLAALWRGKWTIAFVTIIAISIAAYYVFSLATPLYRATTVVILETNQDQIVDLQSVVGGISGDTTEVNSEVEVLRARDLMGKVVDRLDLVNDPEFNKALQPETVFERAETYVRELIGLPEQRVILPAEQAVVRKRDGVVTRLLDKVTIRNVPLSLVFQITVETESAEKSALIADTIVELYILNQIEVKFEATEQATTWLSNRVSELQLELEEAEAAVKDFSASTDLVSIEGLQGLERQIKELRDRIGSAEAARVTAQARLTSLENAVTVDDKVRIANDTQLSRFAQRAESDDAIRTAFDTRFGLVVDRARLELLRADQQLAALLASEMELDAQLERQGEDLIKLQQLTREAEASRLLYEYFLTRLKETSAQQGIQQADSRILSHAIIPNAPAEPRKPLILVLSTILGLLVGAAWVLYREARNNSFRTARDLEAFTGYTVMGQIPLIPARRRIKVLTYLAEKPTSAAAEAVRNLRTSVMLSNVDNPPKIIVSTSSIPGEGKTTNSLALAQNLLGLGKSVLLVEGDIRRRTLNEYFQDMPKKGIVSVLAGDITLEEAVYRPESFGADVLAGDKSSLNAADLFSSDKFKALIQEMRAKYDVIIIDTPPVLVVPDARIISQVADAILFSVKWDSTNRQLVEEAMRLFHNSNQRITGLVLSQISEKGMKRYGYGGKYGSYSAYGTKYYTN
ncbi:capsular exopolysaccharide family [Cognatiyoonia koreensis]|uniref:non-specific protein-tyrosine kinase n=1 Tax=Cognatiyoonia koreensis TaxID=364200 RepID=A0A1I0RM88_9RHOB|nr:polysaccharide biosynthesis tyrosine autokinase [Cognatiyoonia koreensis]SEW42080.1 capsular exopolysaccharide family [Cognatiyoonia koreensis]